MSKRMIKVCAAAFLFTFGISAFAADYPNKLIRIVVAFAPGGGTDIVARIVAKKLTEMYGQQAVVDNRPGAAGNTGSDLVAKSTPDGYMLLMSVNALASNYTLYPNMPFDTLKDLTPIILIGATPDVLVVHPSVPVKNAKEFIALAKAHPNQIAYASTGTGGAAFLAAELFKLETGVKMLHVPYKGAGPALIGLLSGETQAMVVALPPTAAYIKDKRLRPLGLASEHRAKLMPDIPTMQEQGIKNVDFDTWYGLFGPAGMPREIVVKLNESIMKMLAMPDFKEQLAKESIDPSGGTPEAFSKYFRSEVDKLGKVIRASGAKAE